MSQSSGLLSDANSLSHIRGPLCNCGRATTLVKAWTDENPGRRFFRCAVHGFFHWRDEELPHGWQKQSLLEAREEIRRLKEEIKVLKQALRAIDQGVVSSPANMNNDLISKTEEENKKLEGDVMAANEREKLLRQFIVLSWGGFIVVVALILGISKN